MSNFYCKKCGAENYKDSIPHYNTCKCDNPDPKPKIHEEIVLSTTWTTSRWYSKEDHADLEKVLDDIHLSRTHYDLGDNCVVFFSVYPHRKNEVEEIDRMISILKKKEYWHNLIIHRYEDLIDYHRIDYNPEKRYKEIISNRKKLGLI